MKTYEKISLIISSSAIIIAVISLLLSIHTQSIIAQQQSLPDKIQQLEKLIKECDTPEYLIELSAIRSDYLEGKYTEVENRIRSLTNEVKMNCILPVNYAWVVIIVIIIVTIGGGVYYLRIYKRK